MPRKSKDISPKEPPFGEEQETAFCAEPNCGAELTGLDPDGFGLCESGHAGQPVPHGTWRPADPVNKNPMRHEFLLDLNWLSGVGEEDMRDEGADPCEVCHQARAVHTTAADREFQAEHLLHFCDCGHTGIAHFEGLACRFMVNDEHCPCAAWAWEQDSKDAQPPLIEVPSETHMGRAVIGREVGIGGSADLSRYRVAARDWWDTLRIGMSGMVQVAYEVVADGFKPVRVEGQIVGLTDTRKLKLIAFYLPETSDPTEGLPLWEKGTVNAEPAPDDTPTPLDEDESEMLAASLAEAGVE